MIAAMFIDSDYVTQFTMVDSNVDDSLINKAIISAQSTKVMELLGSRLYKKLMDDCPNWTGQYNTLAVEYVKPYLATATVYQLIPYLNYRLTNKSVSQKDSDYSQPVGLPEIEFLRADLRADMEFRGQRVIEYIKNNESLFPEYLNQVDTFAIEPTKRNYYSGIFVGRRNRPAGMPVAPDWRNCCDH
jgi:hypothetical protein